MKTIAVDCPYDHFVVTVPDSGMVNLADYCRCGYCSGGCYFAPFLAEDAPDHLW